MGSSDESTKVVSGNLEVPASTARSTFVGNSKDVQAFYSLHQHFVKTATHGVKKKAYVLDKSMYVLVASLWEAYCEDVVAEGLDLLVEYVASWRSLPPALARAIAKEIRRADVVLAPWELADDGWRQYIRDRQEALAYERNYSFAGSKSASVERFFNESLGLPGIRDVWCREEWAAISQDLDYHLEQRNTLVHRITPGPTVRKKDVKDFYNIICCLVRRTDHAVGEMLVSTTGSSRWTSRVIESPIDIRYRRTSRVAGVE